MSLESLKNQKSALETEKAEMEMMQDTTEVVRLEKEIKSIEKQIAEIEAAAESAKEIPEYQLQQIESHGGNVAEISAELSAVDQEIEKTAEEGIKEVENTQIDELEEITKDYKKIAEEDFNFNDIDYTDEEKEALYFDTEITIKLKIASELDKKIDSISELINNTTLEEVKKELKNQKGEILKERDEKYDEAQQMMDDRRKSNIPGFRQEDIFNAKNKWHRYNEKINFIQMNEDILETKEAEGIQEVQVEDSENIENKTGNTEKTEAEKTDSQIETIEKSGEVTPEEYAQSFEDQLQYLAKKEDQANRWIQESNRQYKETQEEYKKFQEAGGSRVKHEQLFWTQANFDGRLNSLVRDGEHASEMIRSVKKAREDIDKSIKNFEQDKKQLLIEISNTEQEISAIEANIKKSEEEIENARKSYRAWERGGYLGPEPVVSPKSIAEKNSHLVYDLQKAKQQLNSLQDNYNYKYVHGSRNDEKYRNSVYNAFLDKHR